MATASALQAALKVDILKSDLNLDLVAAEHGQALDALLTCLEQLQKYNDGGHARAPWGLEHAQAMGLELHSPL
jgi:hypothetical protein